MLFIILCIAQYANHGMRIKICKSCSAKYEIKSKCMSNPILPKDLNFNHGNYNDYIKRQSTGLDFILIIYSVCRKTKIIKIKKVFWVPNYLIQSTNIIKVIRKEKSTLSEIIVPDYNYLPYITFNQRFASDFSENIKSIINTSINHYIPT